MAVPKKHKPAARTARPRPEETPRVRLDTVRVRGFRSLVDVSLKLGDLTVLVGANSSGKTNCIEALRTFSMLVKATSLPPHTYLRTLLHNEGRVPRGSASAPPRLVFDVQFHRGEVAVGYHVAIQREGEGSSVAEETLTVDDLRVIEMQGGKGEVRDERSDESEAQSVQSDRLALQAAGDFGDKPATRAITRFVSGWKFYDFDPKTMGHQGEWSTLPGGVPIDPGTREMTSLDDSGELIQEAILANAEKPMWLADLNEHLMRYLGLSVKIQKLKSGKRTLRFQDDSLEALPSWLSDGTWRMIAYCLLLLQPTLPTIVVLEEPERNLHPAILKDLAEILRALSQRTQVIVSTHSSQLLDSFAYSYLEKEAEVVLLQRVQGQTKARCLRELLSDDQPALRAWAQDFGVGSALFNSGLIDMLGEL